MKTAIKLLSWDIDSLAVSVKQFTTWKWIMMVWANYDPFLEDHFARAINYGQESQKTKHLSVMIFNAIL